MLVRIFVKAFSSLTRIRPIYAIIAAVAALALVVGVILITNKRKLSDLSIEGQSRELTTYAASVSDLLADEGIEVGEHDLVAPGMESDLEDGQSVVVRYAQQLNLEIDGDERDVWTTAQTAEEALTDMSRRGSETAVLFRSSDSLGRQARTLPLVSGTEVLLVDAGEEESITIAEDTTVGQLFDEQGALLGTMDEVAITSDEDEEADVVITITRIYEENRRSTKKIKYESTTKNDSSMYKGERKVVTEGKNGKKERIHWVRVVDEEVVDKELREENILKEPVDEVIAVGTKERPKPKPKAESNSNSGSSKSSSGGGSATKKAKGSTDSLNWGALAQCESGGSATIVSSNGLYHGLYQFPVPSWKAVGGSGLSSQAPAAEQTARAKMLYERSGAGQWPVCGKNLFK